MRGKRKRGLPVIVQLKCMNELRFQLTLQVGIFLEAACPVLKIAREIFIVSKGHFTIVEILR